ncbi:hypothetical protein HYH03_013170 [Edaphochlamys debaryana]|uniref:Uncharacterized protein n=1 Tax=Edaphochlamys debaryana TaxID=47281 RepID=A0A836BTG5_9CHLO|nr:hypothetical protein HYH03_013170 [Edaphochlamys debaryana]|eukprot:KAG2488320.1 hypothetical protein HYH03_013170 [Edaphochlamys debaryana]
MNAGAAVQAPCPGADAAGADGDPARSPVKRSSSGGGSPPVTPRTASARAAASASTLEAAADVLSGPSTAGAPGPQVCSLGIGPGAASDKGGLRLLPETRMERTKQVVTGHLQSLQTRVTRIQQAAEAQRATSDGMAADVAQLRAELAEVKTTLAAAAASATASANLVAVAEGALQQAVAMRVLCLGLCGCVLQQALLTWANGGGRGALWGILMAVAVTLLALMALTQPKSCADVAESVRGREGSSGSAGKAAGLGPGLGAGSGGAGAGAGAGWGNGVPRRSATDMVLGSVSLPAGEKPRAPLLLPSASAPAAGAAGKLRTTSLTVVAASSVAPPAPERAAAAAPPVMAAAVPAAVASSRSSASLSVAASVAASAATSGVAGGGEFAAAGTTSARRHPEEPEQATPSSALSSESGSAAAIAPAPAAAPAPAPAAGPAAAAGGASSAIPIPAPRRRSSTGLGLSWKSRPARHSEAGVGSAAAAAAEAADDDGAGGSPPLPSTYSRVHRTVSGKGALESGGRSLDGGFDGEASESRTLTGGSTASSKGGGGMAKRCIEAAKRLTVRKDKSATASLAAAAAPAVHVGVPGE